ncbi:Fanconi anemia group I protein [Cynara cardunculus var. scolymus]|uniref:Fanconi anemia group I protein n=1 Tax=Cynara cardunculus var. scolymus TaxID=59895 RepID=UPI000D6246C7|nr:Fanconi anemia group I protein [Cynara cardunculus var. scolymus]
MTTANHRNTQPSLTPDDIIRLAQYHTTAPLHPFLLSPTSHDTLVSHLHTLPPSAVSEYTSSLLSLLSPSPSVSTSTSTSTLLTSLLNSYINLFNSNKIPHDRHSLKTLQLFTAHLDNIPITQLQSISDSIVSRLSQINTDPDESQLLDLLPKCFNIIFNSTEIDKPRDSVNALFDRILDCNWSRVLLVKLVSISRDFQFVDKGRGRQFAEKVFDNMHCVELQDLPSLVYQLLVLASKGFNKREIIKGIVFFFGTKMHMKKTSYNIVREVEGTALLYVNFAVKQDPSLGQEVMGLVRSDLQVIDHFVVGLLLSIARIRRYRESSMGTLKTALSTAYKDYKFSRHCKWLPDGLKEEYLQNAILTEKAVLRAVNESNYGREHIVPSIVQLGFVLLESVEEINLKELENTGLVGSQELGIQMLQSLFEVHDMARNEIIEQCKFRILSLKPEQSLVIIRLLGSLVQNYSYPMLEYVSHLKELLDYFGFMHNKVASHLINVLLPLIKFSHNLQDYIILVVRKAMFRRDDHIRLAAAGAIINVILAEKRSKQNRPCPYQESSSQASSSQVPAIPHGMGSDLFKELSGLLQRCLYQQAKVKERIYWGLLKLVLVDPLTAGEVFDFLLPHFLQYYKEDGQLGIIQSIKMENGKVCIVEPLDDLLSCVSWILILQPQGKSDIRSDSWDSFGFSLTQDTEQAGGTFSGELFSSALLTIRKLLRNENLEGLLGQMKDPASTPQQGERYKYSAQILSGVIEVILNTLAIELEKATNDKKIDLEKEFVDLVDLYGSLEKYTSTSAQSTQSNGTRKGIARSSALCLTYKNESDNMKSFKERASFLATPSIHQLFQTSFELYKNDAVKSVTTSQVHSQATSNSPNQHSRLFYFILNVTLCQTKSFSYVAKDDPLKALIHGDIKVLGPPLLKLIWLLMWPDQKKKDANGKKDNEDRKGLIFLALMCLKELLKVSSQNLDEMREIEDMLAHAVGEDASRDVLEAEDDDNEQVNGINNQREELFITKIVKPLFSELLHAKFYHEVEILCDITNMIGSMSSVRSNLLGAWAIYICKTSDVANPKIAKSVVTLALSCTRAPNDMILACDMALELVKTMGSERQTLLEKSKIYAIINRSTETAIASVLLQLAESVIIDMDRLSMKLKAYLTGAYKVISLDHDGKQNPYFTLEDTLYQRAEAVVELLSSFVVMNLKDPQAEHLLRSAAKFYKNLARLSKFHIAPKGCKQILPSLKCQRLVEVTCKQLTEPLYKFVEMMQQKQQDSRASKGSINKIKRENRCIPDLIFQIEDYEKYLILLSKASKMNLLRHAKRSTARDFRILDPQEQEDGANQEAQPDEGAAQDDLVQDSGDASEKALSPETGSTLAAAEDSDENMIPSAKRKKLGRIVHDSDDEA